MSCRECTHYLPSRKALPNGRGLAGYGYCEAGDTIEIRARLFEASTPVCWHPVSKFSKQVGHHGR